jgi:SH3-like domain-containing protein
MAARKVVNPGRLRKALWLACALGCWLAGADLAVADKVETTRLTRVMSRAGEKGRVLRRIESGKTMEVLAREGRWLKVRVGSTVGWVTRTSVRSTGNQRDARAARTTVGSKRKRAFVAGRSNRRGWVEDAPEDRVGADALDDEDFDEALDEAEDEDDPPRRKVTRKKERKAKRRARSRARSDDFDEDEDEGDEDEDEAGSAAMVVVTAEEAPVFARPTTRSPSMYVAESGDELYVLRASDSGKWLFVEDEEGETGWVRSSSVRGGGGYAYERLGYRADAGIGYTTMGMAFASDGQGALAAYNISSGAATLAIGGEAIYSEYGPTTLIAGDVRYRGTRANPGIRYQDPVTGQAADIAFIMHEIDAGARVGYRTTRTDGLAVYARLGYHFGKLNVANVDNFELNLARLPSELLKGFTVGGHVDVPRLYDKIALHAGLDVLYPGTRAQTAGLEDGAASSVLAAWASGQVRYQWSAAWKIVGEYRYFWSKTRWQGQAMGSMRLHAATTAARTDKVHTLTVGLGKSF